MIVIDMDPEAPADGERIPSSSDEAGAPTNNAEHHNNILSLKNRLAVMLKKKRLRIWQNSWQEMLMFERWQTI